PSRVWPGPVSTALRERPAQAGAGNGGLPARRAVIRWAWRMFRREWRQQLLVLALIIVAVGATVLGAAVATNTPPPANAGFGTASDLATFQSGGPRVASQIAALQKRFGRVAAFGIKASQVDPAADILTARPGLSGISQMQLTYGNGKGGSGSQVNVGPGGGSGPGNGPQTYPCPASSCLANPVIQEVSALPSGTSAPNTVITEH